MNTTLPPIQVAIDADLVDLVPGYLANRRADVERVKLAVAAADWGTIGRIAHGLKGSGGGYGFDDISVIGGAMERAASIAGHDEIVRLLTALEDYLDRVRPVFG